ncbi:MAG: UDP-N-acetyl glucosamine 2-epimerase [Chitinophagaceae bacterium]
MKKIACVVGTRPQLIKHAALKHLLEGVFVVKTINTLQHYQYELNELLKSDLFLSEPFIDLTIEELHPAIRLAEMIRGITIHLQTIKPDAVLVYGDTDSTLAGALAACKIGIQLIHIEAGERSYNKTMPEEHNRVLTDAVADILFCVSRNAMENLHKENNSGISFYSGDLMKDMLLQKAAELSTPLRDDPYVFCTIHRDYTKHNLTKLKELFSTLQQLFTTIIFPLHPATQQTIQKSGIALHSYDNIIFSPPLSYSQSIHYQKFAQAIITDSGGIQKEAYWLKRPCITIRKETEWIETLTGNWNQLVYENLSQIPELIKKQNGYYNAELYGDGTAGILIRNKLATLI